MNTLNLLGGRDKLFRGDITRIEDELADIVSNSKFMVVGGAGSIGQAVCKEIFKRDPALLHIVDISENNLVELVRDIRSSIGYGRGEFQTYALDCGSVEFRALMEKESSGYDYVLNLSALKHVRSESNPYTLMRLVRTNIFNTIDNIRLSRAQGVKKYFCVSTDKAANPVNMMGASKKIMELFMARESREMPVSMARFANVAFSDGSLLHGFNQRLMKGQPISAPDDVKRYFVTPQESGELCLLSTIYGRNLDIFFPKLSEGLHLIKFSDIARNYLRQRGYEPYECGSEQEARALVGELSMVGQWPCYFFDSDTTGEKDFEEFFTSEELVDNERFESLGVVKANQQYNGEALDAFELGCKELLAKGSWTKDDLVRLFYMVLPSFAHLETGKYLDQRM